MPDQVDQANAVRQGPQEARGAQGPLSPAGVTALKAAIVIMGIMIVVCVIIIIGRIIYLASKPGGSEIAVSNQQVQLPSSVDFALPVGASVKHVSLDHSRAAVTFQVQGQTKIGIFDLHTGKKITEIRLTVELPSASGRP